MSNTCIQCGTKFVGRKDKIFCGDYCRSAYHNTNRREDEDIVKSINNILKKNRKILQSLVVNNRTKSTRQKLIEEGFNFSYFTNEYTTKAGKIYRYCYDYGYTSLEGDLIAIVEKKSYV